MQIPFSSRFIIASDVLAQELNGETVLLDLKSERYFGLDHVGTRIWQFLQEQHDVQFMYDSLLSEFDVQHTRLEEDLMGLLSQLLSENLICTESSRNGSEV